MAGEHKQTDRLKEKNGEVETAVESEADL